ncbi:hypothetical protein [uncultured Caulobacter sp.]|uniref:hypothetical protein n=1 Tax=uncultured Caulobacter sp. TaxID=158749 RepID=UPI002639EEF8|nr:hypothetical protein [uncultured Caulobacter sp.]
MSYYDQDAPDVVQFGDRRQKAVKEYRCDTCPLGGPPSSAIIPVGQEYRRQTGTIDGEFFTSRGCVGPCPHMTDCGLCLGTGVIETDQKIPETCPRCDGSGKARTP